MADASEFPLSFSISLSTLLMICSICARKPLASLGRPSTFNSSAANARSAPPMRTAVPASHRDKTPKAASIVVLCRPSALFMRSPPVILADPTIAQLVALVEHRGLHDNRAVLTLVEAQEGIYLSRNFHEGRQCARNYFAARGGFFLKLPVESISSRTPQHRSQFVPSREEA